MKYQQKQQKGFTLIEIMIAVLLVGLLAGMAVPNFIRSRSTAQKNVCVSNLRNIDEAIQQWALELKKAANSPVQFDDISDYLRRSIVCPSGGATFADSYAITLVGAEPSCLRAPTYHLIDQLIGDGASAADPSQNGDPSVSSGRSTSAHGNNGNANGHSNGNNGKGKGGSKP